MKFLPFAALLAILLVWGCGGTGNAVNNTTTTTGNSTFAGNYSGLWVGSPSNNAGTISLGIDNSGNVSGKFSAAGSSGAITGVIAGSGAFQAQAKFPSGVDTLTGALLLSGTTLQGSLLSQGVVNEEINVTVSEPKAKP